MSTNLNELIGWLEKANEGSRALDVNINDALGYPMFGFPAVTSSTNGAFDLINKMLPKHRVFLDSDPHRSPLWRAGVRLNGESEMSGCGYAPTAALALCIAALKAVARKTQLHD